MSIYNLYVCTVKPALSSPTKEDEKHMLQDCHCPMQAKALQHSAMPSTRVKPTPLPLKTHIPSNLEQPPKAGLTVFIFKGEFVYLFTRFDMRFIHNTPLAFSGSRKAQPALTCARKAVPLR